MKNSRLSNDRQKGKKIRKESRISCKELKFGWLRYTYVFNIEMIPKENTKLFIEGIVIGSKGCFRGRILLVNDYIGDIQKTITLC